MSQPIQNDHVRMINTIIKEDPYFTEYYILSYDSTEIILDNLFIITDNFTEFSFHNIDSAFLVAYNRFVQIDTFLTTIITDSSSIEWVDSNYEYSLFCDSINQTSINDLVWSDRINDTIRELDIESTNLRFNSSGLILTSKPLFLKNCDTAIMCMDIITADHYINNLYYLKRNKNDWEIIKKDYEFFKLLKFFTGVDKNNQITGKGTSLVVLGLKGSTSRENLK
ncbi:hypothetical protein [Lentimicrobium sp. S6]|uniref:hypothetical protein n=1 Tax=Lentimicrobium sp. S6 TaxID=2735872 RepID=UPI00155478C4|nr:hypothetical protein [Lentimicrobium sp. S6]NPD48334.1 hypothetical protein [Lentimicrobium sp. S6]